MKKKDIRVQTLSIDIKLITLLLFLTISFMEIGFASVNEFHSLPSQIFYMPFYAIVPLFLSLFLIKNLIYHYRIIYTYFVGSFLLANLFMAYFLIHLALGQGGIIAIVIYIFMTIFYGTFLWDFFKGLSFSTQILSEFTERLSKIYLTKNIKNNMVKVNGRDFFEIRKSKKNKKSIFLISLTVCLLPFVLLGKGLSYIFLVTVNQYFDSHAYFLSSVGFPVTLFFLMIFSSVTIAMWKLEYSFGAKE